MKKIKVAVVSGGNGSAITLQALKKYVNTMQLSAILGTADSAGSSGRLRREFGVIPPGDILRAILSLSPFDYSILRKIFYEVRFNTGGKLKKHNLGNIFLTLGGQYSKNTINAISALSESVGALGQVIPVTLKPVNLAVELNNGKIIRGDDNIDVPQYSRRFKIVRALPTVATVNHAAVKTLCDADYILFGPGSLYTSIIAPLTIKGIYNAIKKSSARLIFLATNYGHIFGETGPENLSGVIAHLEKHLPRTLDLIIFNSHLSSKEEQMLAKVKKWFLIERDDGNLKPYHNRIKFYDFGKTVGIGCDSVKLGKILQKIIK